MAVEARIKSSYRLKVVTAFGGKEYVKEEWRPVMAEQAGSAEAHPFLEMREVRVSAEEAPSTISAEPPASRRGKES